MKPENDSVLEYRKSILNDFLEATQEFFKDKKDILGFPLETDKCVLYTGNPSAEIMVFGRDLGQVEVKRGEVLCGPAGQLFRKRSKQVGFKPLEDFFMFNTVPFRPKDNKAFPKTVRDFFWKSLNIHIIRLVNPKIILALGNEALSLFKKDARGITKETGIQFRMEVADCQRVILPCVHPSYIIRGNFDKKDERRLFIQPLIILNRLYKTYLPASD